MTKIDGFLRSPEDEAARAAREISARMLSAEKTGASLDALKSERDRLVTLARAQGRADTLTLALMERLEALEARLAALEGANGKP